MHTKPRAFTHIPSFDEIKNYFPGIKALFFDMDGTLFDTEALHADALVKMARHHGIRSPLSHEKMYELMVGRADHLLFELIKNWEGVPPDWNSTHFVAEKNKNFLSLLKDHTVSSFFDPGVNLLLNEAKKNEMFIALVTSSEKLITQEILKAVKLENFFQLVLTRDDCLKHKPDPWPYLKAREISSFESGEIVIFEDSQVGLEAALKSGSHVAEARWYSP